MELSFAAGESIASLISCPGFSLGYGSLIRLKESLRVYWLPPPLTLEAIAQGGAPWWRPTWGAHSDASTGILRCRFRTLSSIWVAEHGAVSIKRLRKG